MNDKNEVTLRVGGNIHAGWTSVEITRSLETISGAFSLGVTEQWPGHQNRFQVAPGMAGELAIGGEVVITGHVDDVDFSYSDSEHSVSVRGRDATGDLVDCSALSGTGHWTSVSLNQVAADICAPFGIKVASNVPDTAKLLPEHHIQLGETAHECLERLARVYGVMMMSDGKGGMLLTRAGDGGAAAGLRLGGNIKAASASLSDRERFSRYTILGQSTATDAISVTVASACHAEATDAGITRYRPLVVIAEDTIDPSWYQRRATWEAANRAGKSRRSAVTVQGWRDADGALYQPNTMVTLDDDWTGMHERMLIAKVKFTLSDQGTLTELTLVRREAFELVPPVTTLYAAGTGA